MSEFEKVTVENASEDSPSESYGEKPKLFDLNEDPPDNKFHHDETSLNLKTKTYRVESRNIIGKNVIQEFFNCTRVIPLISGSILYKTNSYVDAIVMLVVKLECFTKDVF
jgi:hypothetical protein